MTSKAIITNKLGQKVECSLSTGKHGDINIVQANVFAPGNSSAGFFIVMAGDDPLEAARAAEVLLHEYPALDPDEDITGLVPGALAAKTMHLPKVSLGSA